MIDPEHEAMKREVIEEQRYESNCWDPNGEPCKECRFNNRCRIKDENEGRSKLNNEDKRKVVQEFLLWIENQGWIICDSGQDMRGDYFYSPIHDADGFIEGFLKGAGK